MQLSRITHPEHCLLVATQFLNSDVMTWYQSTSDIVNWEQLKQTMTVYYKPHNEQVNARDGLKSFDRNVQWRSTVDSVRLDEAAMNVESNLKDR
jgi:hypothetical protein